MSGVQVRGRIAALVDQGRAFSSTTGVLNIAVSTANYLLYFLGGANMCRLTRVIFSAGPGNVSSGGGTFYISSTPTGTITGTDLTKLNRLIGYGKTATATVKGTLSGVTGKGDVMYAYPFNVNKPVLLEFPDGIILLPGKKLLISCDIEGVTLNVAASIEWTEEEID
jgi:hypothetical protein